MPTHPQGGSGKRIKTKHTFATVRERVGEGLSFLILGTVPVVATKAWEVPELKTILLRNDDGRLEEHICAKCWGLSISCNGRSIGPLIQAVDDVVANKVVGTGT